MSYLFSFLIWLALPDCLSHADSVSRNPYCNWSSFWILGHEATTLSKSPSTDSEKRNLLGEGIWMEGFWKSLPDLDEVISMMIPGMWTAISSHWIAMAFKEGKTFLEHLISIGSFGLCWSHQCSCSKMAETIYAVSQVSAVPVHRPWLAHGADESVWEVVSDFLQCTLYSLFMEGTVSPRTSFLG